MDRSHRFRITLVQLLILLVAAVYIIRLFALQLITEDEASYDSSSTTTYTQTVAAARGEILDRHGTILISNRATYSITINNFVLYNSGKTNDYLLTLAETCRKNGIEYTDRLPISLTTPYTYTTDTLSDGDQYTFRRYLLGREWDADMTAENFMKRLRESFRIPDDYTELQARLVIGLRYELDLPTYANTDTYTLTEDVSAEQLAIIKELAIPGLDVSTSTVRETNTAFAAQLLGHVATIPAEQAEKYAAMGYDLDAQVGVDGFELAFEEYLHGTDGKKVVTVTADGTVVDEYWEVEPESGANVITTIDIGLQEAAEESLAAHIQALAESKGEGVDGWDADAGAVVVMDVHNGEVLASANYPTYDAREYAEKYNEMLEAEETPLANRALMYAYPPGSTFKPITAIAAMRAGISPGFSTMDSGTYAFDDGLRLACWIYTQNGYGHGALDMRGAIAQSCNIFFYTVGVQIGIRRIIDVATSFGIGQDSGSEVFNNPGQMASPELKEELYTGNEAGFWDADVAMAAIGQSMTEVTPLQMCRYVTALANRGTLYKATFLRRAVDSDFQTLVHGNDYVPEGTELLSQSEWQVIYDGMRLCVTEGTAKGLKDYPVAVCAKTGTASHGTGGSDNGAFVCYAPAEDPEIAIAIYVEHGASGSNFADVAADVMDYYFNYQDQIQEIEIENQMTQD